MFMANELARARRLPPFTVLRQQSAQEHMAIDAGAILATWGLAIEQTPIIVKIERWRARKA
eukprot:2193021-Pleurochrysis_carterae.AAC.1